MSSHLWNLVKKELRELLTPSSLLSVLAVVVLFIAMGLITDLTNKLNSRTKGRADVKLIS